MSPIERLLQTYADACEHADQLAATAPPDDRAVCRADAVAELAFEQLLSFIPTNVADLAVQTREHLAWARTEHRDGHAGCEADRSRRLLDSWLRLRA
jgi:hypothetical protein